MKGTIGLEFIGCNTFDVLREFSKFERSAGIGIGEKLPNFGPSIAAVTRQHDGQVRLDLLHGKRDYSKSNSKGSRGVVVWYTLEQDTLYYVREPKSWKHVDDYYAAVTSRGDVFRLSRMEADEWLSAL